MVCDSLKREFEAQSGTKEKPKEEKPKIVFKSVDELKAFWAEQQKQKEM